MAGIRNTPPYTAVGIGAKKFSPNQAVAAGMSESQNGATYDSPGATLQDKPDRPPAPADDGPNFAPTITVRLGAGGLQPRPERGR